MWSPARALIVVIAGVAALAGCSKTETASNEPRIVEQQVAFGPQAIPVKIGPLSGELTDVFVMRRVYESTGAIVYAPHLTGTLTLKNTSEDEAVRVLGGDVTYIGTDGAPVALPPDRGTTAFTFPSYSVERLDPGQETRQNVDVPFPNRMFDSGLVQLQFGLDYLTMPYHEGTATVGLTAGSRG